MERRLNNYLVAILELCVTLGQVFCDIRMPQKNIVRMPPNLIARNTKQTEYKL
jgi:hypothetical protein